MDYNNRFMKYIPAEKLTKSIEDKGLDCSFALKMERLDTLALIDKLQQEQPEVDLEKELGRWRHKHFKGKRDGDYSGEYLERESQLDLARHFYELGLNAKKEE